MLVFSEITSFYIFLSKEKHQAEIKDPHKAGDELSCKYIIKTDKRSKNSFPNCDQLIYGEIISTDMFFIHQCKWRNKYIVIYVTYVF